MNEGADEERSSEWCLFLGVLSVRHSTVLNEVKCDVSWGGKAPEEARMRDRTDSWVSAGRQYMDSRNSMIKHHEIIARGKSGRKRGIA